MAEAKAVLRSFNPLFVEIMARRTSFDCVDPPLTGWRNLGGVFSPYSLPEIAARRPAPFRRNAIQCLDYTYPQLAYVSVARRSGERGA